MGNSVGDLFLYGAIASAILFLATLAFVTIEDAYRNPHRH